MTVVFALLIVGAYLLGSVPAAYLVAKWSRGVDLRKYGSGNVGASNVLAVASKRWSIPVIVFDIVKGMAIVYIAKIMGLETYQQIIVGIAAIAGHNWPVFLRFSGGRGFLTLLGVVFILAPKLALVLTIIAFAFLPFGQLAIGTLCAATLLPIVSWFSSTPIISWLFGQPLGINERLPVTLGFLAIFLIVVIRRLTAPRTSLSKSVPPGQLFINRLLFDRDIRNRKAWIHRALPGQQEKG